jgi:hypothetical protein
MTAAAVTLRHQSHLALPFADSGITGVAAFVLVGLSCPAFPLLTMRRCLGVVPLIGALMTGVRRVCHPTVSIARPRSNPVLVLALAGPQWLFVGRSRAAIESNYAHVKSAP